MSSTDDHEDQVDQGTAVPVTSQPQSRTESPAPKSQPSLPYTISYSATGTPLSVTYQLPSLPTQQQTHPQLQLAPALLPQPSHLAQQLTQAQLAQPPAQIQLAPAIQPQPQAISNAAGTQLAVAYLLPVMPGQQPTHLLGTQPTQPTVKVQGVKFVRPQSQVNPMSVQQPPMQQENVVISDIPQTVPQSPVQCDLNLAYGRALQSGRLANVTSSPEVQQVVTENRGFNKQPNVNYTPSNYYVLTVVMATLCGLFSPATLFCSIPAVFMSIKSKNSGEAGDMEKARSDGLYALRLIFITIVVALSTFFLVTTFSGLLLRSGCVLVDSVDIAGSGFGNCPP